MSVANHNALSFFIVIQPSGSNKTELEIVSVMNEIGFPKESRIRCNSSGVAETNGAIKQQSSHIGRRVQIDSLKPGGGANFVPQRTDFWPESADFGLERAPSGRFDYFSIPSSHVV